MPDATTIWLFREASAQAGLINKLFERFGQHLEAEGYIARGGQIIDATIVSVPKQRNTKRGERDDQGRQDAGGMGIASPPRTPRRTRTRAGRRRMIACIRLQEPPRRRPPHKLVRRYVGATRACTTVRSSTMCSICAIRQRTSGPTAPIAAMQIEEKRAERGLQSRIHRRAARNRRCRSAEVRQHDALEGARACRARIRSPAELAWAVRSCAPSASRARGSRSG